MSAWTWIAVAALGGLGTIARFAVHTAIEARTSGRFPFGTLAVNLSGAFALGVLAGLAVGGELRLLAGTATLGAYTTFSTWMLESHRLADDGAGRLAWVNVLGSLVVGFGAVALGHAIGVGL